MRLVKTLLTGLLAIVAVIGGVVATVAVALAAAVFFALRRGFRRPVPAGPSGHARPRARSAGEAIEVVATEVPVEPPAQLR